MGLISCVEKKRKSDDNVMRKEDGAKAAAASVYSSTGRISRRARLIYAPGARAFIHFP